MALLGAFTLGVIFWFWCQRKLDQWQRRRRATLASNGENKAEAILRAAGYRIDARQVRTTCSLEVDDEPVTFELIADLWVEKDGQQLIAEVKSGAGRFIQHAGTRRQLLEYALAFDVDGVLLVDAVRGTVHRIDFGLTQQRIVAA